MSSLITDALGRVTAALPNGGESRPGQVTMAKAVERAISERRHVIVQAGTGTGKSLAYLVPAVLLGVKTVVATATKALQDQLANKDLPLVAAHLGTDVDFSVLKGRSNYLCLQKAREVAGGDSLDLAPSAATGEVGSQLRAVISWARTSQIGDRAELDFEPSPRVWAQLSTTSTDCPGAMRCPSGDECFAERARRRAEEAAVVPSASIAGPFATPRATPARPRNRPAVTSVPSAAAAMSSSSWASSKITRSWSGRTCPPLARWAP